MLGAAAELLDDDETVLSSGDMTWRTGVIVSGPTFITQTKDRRSIWNHEPDLERA
jgi:nucleoside phosphorylase